MRKRSFGRVDDGSAKVSRRTLNVLYGREERRIVDPFELAKVGTTGLAVTTLGLGGAPLGTPPPDLSDQEAVETIRRALSLEMRYVDTKGDKRTVAVRPMPPFRPVFQLATTRPGSSVSLTTNPELSRQEAGGQVMAAVFS